jgi:hypothetical protein
MTTDHRDCPSIHFARKYPTLHCLALHHETGGRFQMSHNKITEPTPLEEDEQARLIERPDGYYWQNKLTEKLYGPFATLIEAMEDTEYQEDSDYEEGASLHEAEAEIGIADWINPDTGELAEGSSPHFSD